MRHFIGRVWVTAGLVSLTGLAGCRESCDKETVERARAFMEAHQSCEADADCVVVSDFCEEIPGGWCGQLVMSRSGKESAEWRSIEKELDACAPDECTVCAGAANPRCANGSCGGPEVL